MASSADPALRLRVLSALVLAPVALALVVLGGWGFTALVVLAVFLMALEWARLASARYGRRHGWFAGLAVLVVSTVSTLLAGFNRPAAGLVVLALGAALAAAAAWCAGAAWRWTGAGVGYVGLPALALVWLRSMPEMGLGILIWLLAVVWSTDSAAYFVGRRLGGPRLAPSISPGKTWSGFYGGILGAVLASLAVAWSAGSGRLVQAAMLGALLAVVAQCGDLAESALKRRAGVKDTSTLIPGHGGVLDRVDGLLFAAPALALAGILIGPKAWPWP